MHTARTLSDVNRRKHGEWEFFELPESATGPSYFVLQAIEPQEKDEDGVSIRQRVTVRMTRLQALRFQDHVREVLGFQP
jgi:hypothetical protein